jgi:hypothetical protein
MKVKVIKEKNFRIEVNWLFCFVLVCVWLQRP